MDENNALLDLLEPSLPGAWIVEHNQIGQISLLEAKELAQFCSARGLSDFRETGIIQLWQLGLLKADLIESDKELSYDGLVAHGTDPYGYYRYSDERQLQQRTEGWENARKTITPLSESIKLLFHPFRYYVIYHLDRMLDGTISKTQMFHQENYSRVQEWALSSFNNWASSDQFIPSIKKWNDIASLCILTEPCIYQRIFHSIKYNPAELQNHQAGVEEIINHIDNYWHTNVEELYLQIGMDRLEKIRKELGYDTKRLEPNQWVHTLICLGDSKQRLELEGHLGGAILLRTMTEMLRRASEEAFNTEIEEEDELGFGRMKDIKKDLYGASRLLDNHEAGSEFARWHGLNYKTRVHLYTEGTTEYGALNHFFKQMGIFVSVTNLHGLIKLREREGDQMLTFFKDRLQSDIKDHVYSIVMIDGDLKPNVRVIENHARINQTSENEGMFGRFFIADPDFELENFEIEELEEILWKWVAEYTEKNPSQEDREQLHSYVKDVVGSTEFFDSVKHATRDIPESSEYQLTEYKKGGEWGAKLMDYAWEHPLKQNRKRQIVEVVELAIRWEKIINMERYDEAKKKYMISLEKATRGKLIVRSDEEQKK